MRRSTDESPLGAKTGTPTGTYGKLGGGARYWLRRISEEGAPGRFLLSRLLWRSGLCRFLPLTIRFPDGFRMRFHPTAMAARLWQEPDHWADDLDFFKGVVRPGDTCLDIGANIGFFSMAAACYAGPTGQVVSIEPHPRTFTYLMENAKLNGFAVRGFNCALGADAGRQLLSDVYSDDQNALMTDEMVQRQSGLEVPVRTLDAVIAEALPTGGTIDLLKIDTEGYEKFVFEGAGATLARTACIYFESSPPHCRRYGYEPEVVPQMLRDSGFTIYQTGAVAITTDSQGIATEYRNLIALRDPISFLTRTKLKLETYP